MTTNSFRTTGFAQLVLAAFALAVVSADAAANYALRTTGTASYFRTWTASTTLTPSKTFTLEVWVKPTGAGTVYNEVDQFVESNWDYNFVEIASTGDVLIGLPGISGALSIGKVTFGEWNHIAVRYDASNSTYTGFVNGQKAAGFLAGTRTFPPGATFLCFARNGINKVSAGGWLVGDFDEIRLWNIARTDSQITSNWISKITSAQTGLVMNWHLDEGTGATIQDSSGFNNTGLVSGSTWVESTLQNVVPPVISLVSATVQSNKVVQLSTVVDTGGSPTDVYFEYGPTTAYGSNTARISLPAATNTVTVFATLSNLVAGTYNFRTVATNAGGQVVSLNAAFAITNQSGMAISLTNGSSFFRSSKTTRPFFTTNTITVEFWFEADSPGVLINEVDQFDTTKWDYSFMEVRTNGSLVAGMPGLPNVEMGSIQFGKWYHTALRYDSATLDLTAFLNGVPTGTSHGVRSVPWATNRTVFLAFGRGGATNLSGSGFLRGKFDEVRIWQTARTDQQILEARDLILSGKESGLFALWSFESISSGTSPDRSSNANPAFIVGTVNLDVSTIDLSLDLRPTAVTTLGQDSLGDSVVLTGTVTSPLTNTLAYFVWGNGTTNLTNKTASLTLGSGTNSAQAILNGLIGGQTYSYALVASNSAGTVQGNTVSFRKLSWAGYSLSLTNGSYIRMVNDQHAFFTDETITIEVWVKPFKAGVVVTETDRTSTTLDSSLVEILTSGSVVAGFPGVPTVVIGKVDFNVWNNIVLRYDKASLKMEGFVNGVKSTNSSTGDRVVGWEIGRQPVYAFGKATTDKIGTGEFLNAEWDEIRLWNIARSDADILANYSRKLLGTEIGMVAYYRFDDQVTNISDSSRHNNLAGISGTGTFAFVVSNAPVTVTYVPVAKSASGDLTVQFLGVPGREIQLEYSADLTTWTPGASAVVDSLGVATLNGGKVTDATMRFFRGKQL
jgi:hypothetical protein